MFTAEIEALVGLALAHAAWTIKSLAISAELYEILGEPFPNLLIASWVIKQKVSFWRIYVIGYNLVLIVARHSGFCLPSFGLFFSA
eukprot:897209-Amorphochlora_amoeboformis.AAC.2